MNEFAPMMRPSRKTLVLSLLGLAAFLAVEALLLRQFVRADARLPSWDQSAQMELALDVHEGAVSRPGLPPQPPVYQRLLSGSYSSKDPAHAALWVNWGYMALLAVALFGISWMFLPDARALAGTLAFCAAPGLQGLLTTQLPDLALAAVVAAAYWALIATEGFTAWVPSVVFGALFGLGMLHHWSFASFMIPAYVIGLRAMGDRHARLKVLASAAVALVLLLPWYAAHWTDIPAWLARRWAEGGESFANPGAWIRYAVLSAGDLGPPLWALGFISLLAPQYLRRRDNGWILGYWVACSYVLWTLVPDRQARFLFPGLVPLGLAMAATWPPSLTWSVTAFQLLCLLNFFFGLVGPLRIPTPLVPMVLMENRPAVRADWKIPEILEKIESSRDASRAVAPTAFLANGEDFNPRTFAWAQRWLKKPHALLRGMDAKRLTELSEFVLAKDGRLGPDEKIGDLPAGVKALGAPESWFPAAYEALDRWPLPDGSSATLYRLRRRAKPGGNQRLSYTYFEAGTTQTRGLNVDLGAWDDARSAWPLVMLSADRVDVPGLKVHALAADLENFSFVPLYEGGAGDYAWNDMRLTRLDKVTVRSLQVDAADLQAFLEKRIPGLKVDALTLDGTAKASGSWNGKAIMVEAAPDLDRAAQSLRLRIVSATYAGFPVPAAFFKRAPALEYSLAPTPERPFALDLPGVSLRNGRLTVP